jgi:hypothetical protein
VNLGQLLLEVPISLDNARKNQFQINFILKAHKQGTGTAIHYFTLIDARENQHPMKYGQLVKKLINSSGLQRTSFR